MGSLTTISLAIRQRLFDNLPPLIPQTSVRFPNMDIVQPNNDHFLNVKIEHDGRVRKTIGQRDYELRGLLSISLFSPVDMHTVDHEETLDLLRDVFDDLSVTTSTGDVVFSPSYIATVGEVDNFYVSNVVSEFTYFENRG